MRRKGCEGFCQVELVDLGFDYACLSQWERLYGNVTLSESATQVVETNWDGSPKVGGSGRAISSHAFCAGKVWGIANFREQEYFYSFSPPKSMMDVSFGQGRCLHLLRCTF